MCASAWAGADEPPKVSAKPEAELFKDAPAPWRDYLIKAVAAERIADPLQRCLAYPDLPGNQWPAGHVRAHCMDHSVRAMPMADAAKLLEAGKADELEAYVRRIDGVHARHEDVGEEIHYFFRQFRSEDADAITTAWLQAKPDSPYALTARGNYHSGKAGRARGGKWASETPRENLREMTAQYELALPLYRKAVAIDPRFIEAWNSMLVLAYRDSRAELEQEAFKAANAIDPGCQDLVDTRMTSLQPRWGGSYEAMLAYAESLRPLLPARPILARQMAAPYGDRGNRLYAEDEFTIEAVEILDIAARIGSNEDYLEDAAKVARIADKDAKGVHDPWKGLAYAMQAARFGEREEWTHRIISWAMVREAPDIAVRNVEIALRKDPDSTWLHYLAGGAYYNSKRPEQAEPHYLKAVEDSEQRQASLRELVTMWMYDAGLTPKEGSIKAKPYLDRLIREYPDDGRARMYRVQSEGAINGVIPEQLIVDFEKRADPKDPPQAWFLQRLAEWRKNPVMRSAPAKAK
ncbi:MAG: hypothetical protein QM612_03545 [Thermomonas sp.]|uniref:tetratricopeptide repeat protein n=1 Tax=Thermomonas sp. TaxID=1971895 RepID=UPI0039E380CF